MTTPTAQDALERQKALEGAISQIEKQHGKGSIMRMGETQTEHVDVIPTGSLALDIALGIGGVPRGRVVEIYGPESSGKTTLALHIMAEAQKAGGIAAFIDAEHAQDPRYARRLGVDVDNLLISQPDSAEQALEITEALVRSGAVDVVVIDSVAALAPRAELEGEMGDAHVGLQARLMSQALRKLTGAISRSRTTVVFTNQIREKVGVMFGNPETTPGGRALKFYATIRCDIRRVEVLKQGTDNIGMRAKVKVVKNKLAPPFKEAEFDILYGTGISREGDILDLGVEAGVIQKSGPWFSYGDTRLGQGREQARDFLRQNAATADEIENLVRQHFGLPPIVRAVKAAAPSEASSAPQALSAAGAAAEGAPAPASRRSRAERAVTTGRR
ncbi:MAG: recombinase RecA [Limnochordaceae bacterium]|nr:recombinase RecA [Limnochordaceae bacterium]